MEEFKSEIMEIVNKKVDKEFYRRLKETSIIVCDCAGNEIDISEVFMTSSKESVNEYGNAEIHIHLPFACNNKENIHESDAIESSMTDRELLYDAVQDHIFSGSEDSEKIETRMNRWSFTKGGSFITKEFNT